MVKNYTKTDIKVSCHIQFCLIYWHYFINFVRDCWRKVHDAVSLLSMVNKAFENLLNNKLVDHLHKCGLFSESPVRSAKAVVLHISKAFDKIWHAGLLHKCKSREISVLFVALFYIFSVIDVLKWFWMRLLYRNIQLMLISSRLRSWSYAFLTIR